eukprot:COSAG01_NODE_1152_length_11492_cov_12.314842_3_plen_91_part_00
MAPALAAPQQLPVLVHVASSSRSAPSRLLLATRTVVLRLLYSYGRTLYRYRTVRPYSCTVFKASHMAYAITALLRLLRVASRPVRAAPGP